MLRRMVAILVIGVVGITLGAVAVMAAESNKEKAAIASAERWLEVVDKGKYADSWQESSEYFRQAIKSDQWVQAMQAARNPLGKLMQRTMKSASFAASLPGAPPGEYVVVEFNAVFENKKAAIETVTPKMDGDGIWRVSGYMIQ